MNPFVFQSPTRVMFGEYTTAACGDFVLELGGKRALVVADAFLVQSGVLGPLLESLSSQGLLPPVVFSDVPPDSDIACVDRGAAIAREAGCDCIVAIGGGSVIDTAKVIGICLTLGGELLDYQGLNVIDKKLMPLVVVPTTAGTGSEVSFVAMIKDHKEGKKLMFGSSWLAPDVAILDPSLLLSLPPKLTAATGLDAITHGIEAFVAANTNSVATDALCLEALRLLFDNLPRAFKNGDDMEARSATLVASTMAGIAFSNSGVGVIHALAHSVGAMFSTHHGMTNGVFLPYGMEFNLPQVAPQYARIARYLELEGVAGLDQTAAAELLIKAVRQLLKTLSLPVRLRDLGIESLSEDDYDELACLAASDPAIMFNPRDCNNDDLIDLMKRAY